MPNQSLLSRKRVLIFFLISILFNSCSTSNLNKRGFKNLSKGKYKKADKLFNKVLERNYRNSYAYYGLGDIDYRKGNYYSAIKHFEDSEKYGNKKANVSIGFSWLKIAEKNYKNSQFYDGISAIDKALKGIPDFEGALKLKPKLLLGCIETDIKLKKANVAWKRFNILKNKEIPFTELVTNDLNFLEPHVLLLYASYNLKNGNEDIALEKTNRIIEENNTLFIKYRNEGKRLRSQIFEFKSDKYFNLKDYDLSLINIEKAINDFPNKDELIYKKSVIYEKISDEYLLSGNLEKALNTINLSIDLNHYLTIKSSKKIRSDIYYAYALKEKDINQKVIYAQKSLSDNSLDKKLKIYIYNLYLQLVSEFIDSEDYISANQLFKKAINLDPTHKEIYWLYDKYMNYQKSLEFNIAVAEIYAINLRYKKAINILENYNSFNSSNENPLLVYNLAKYFSANGEQQRAINELLKFYSDNELNKYYTTYIRKSVREPSFILLENNEDFYKWKNKINRINLSLNYINNIPKADIISDSDPFLEISHKSVNLLTTPKAQDKRNITWDKNIFNVTFDYDFNYPISVKVSDSDLTYDDPIFNNSYSGFFPGNWDIILDENSGAILNISIKDCYNCNAGSSYNELPPKAWFFKALEANHIRDGLERMRTIYSPEVQLKYGNVYQDYYTIWGAVGDLTPCFATFFINKAVRGFITRQIFYGVIQYFFQPEISGKKFTLEAFIEFMLKKVGNSFLNNINDFRVFCECSYDALKK